MSDISVARGYAWPPDGLEAEKSAKAPAHWNCAQFGGRLQVAYAGWRGSFSGYIWRKDFPVGCVSVAALVFVALWQKLGLEEKWMGAQLGASYEA